MLLELEPIQAVEPVTDVLERAGQAGLPTFVRVTLFVQFVALCAWTRWVYDTWNVHVDFASRTQAVFGILHGNLNPLYTIMGWSQLADHFDLSMYPAALLTTVWPHLMWLFIIQVALLIVAELGALRVLDLAIGHAWWPGTIRRNVAFGVVLVIFCANPFIVWGVAADLHFHMFGAVAGMTFVALYFLEERWRRMTVAALVTLAFGDMGAQLLVAVGIVLAWLTLRSPGKVKAAGGLVLGGIAWWAITSWLVGSAGSELGLHYGYLAGSSAPQIPLGHVVVGLVSHPATVAHRVPAAFGSMWGPLSIGGVLGLLTPASVPVALNAVEAGLGVQTWIGWPYSSTGSMAEMPWQLLPMLIVEPVLTLVALAWLQRGNARFRRSIALITPVFLVIMVVNALLWSVFWFPPVLRSINLTPPATVSELNTIADRIPAANEVVASLGVVGRLSDRQYVYLTVFGSAETVIPLKTPNVDFVITPVTGQESNAVDLEYLTSYLLQQPNATLVSRSQNVWFFTYHRRPGQTEMTVDYQAVDISGTALPTPAHSHATPNWPAQGCISTNARSGAYFISNYRNALPPGKYLARLRVWNTGKMLVQVGDDDTHRLLARGWVRSSPGLRAVTLPFAVDSSGNIPVSSGWGPYHLSFPIPQTSDMIEIRVWSSGPGARSICSISLFPRI